MFSLTILADEQVVALLHQLVALPVQLATILASIPGPVDRP